jgi:ribose 5-phosphate isomerase B
MGRECIALAADHAGFLLKNILKVETEKLGYAVLDLGTNGADSVDYPDFAYKMAEALRDGRATRGVLVCGTGIGIAIAANRFPWVRAGVAHDATSARLTREHNDANVLALGARLIGEEVARDCLATFLSTRYGAGRHARRVGKLGHPDLPAADAGLEHAAGED